MPVPQRRPQLTLDPLEDRRLFAYGDWPVLLNLDDVWTQYPHLNGGNNSIAVVDKGIDYYHPVFGGSDVTSTVAPRIVNVYDWRDNDATPFPSESSATDPSTAHGTGVAGILIANPWTDASNEQQQGVLQSPSTKIYNLRTNRFNSQATTELALQWVIANRVSKNITAVALTDFVGGSGTLSYSDELATLKAAGVFIITPVANDWIFPGNERAPIGNPASDPSVFGAGGIIPDGTLRPQSQRGPGLDILGPAQQVTMPYYTPQTNTHQLLTGTNGNPNSGGQGNSWAGPYVLGVAVMLQQIDPTLTADEIMDILQDSGVQVVDPDNVSNPSGTITYARLDALAAVQMAYARRDDALDQAGAGNDVFANASTIPVASGDGAASSQKLLIGDPDWFKFTVTTADRFNLSVDYAGSSTHPMGTLYAANGTQLAQLGDDGISRVLTPGTYYVRVLNVQTPTLSGTYSVTVDDDDSPPPPIGVDGTFNAIAYAPDGTLHFAWFDTAAHKLKHAYQTSGVWSNVNIVDNVANTGQFMSMAVNSAGLPGVAYYDEGDTALKYAQFNGQTWITTTVDAANTTGYYPSLKYGTNDKPIIAYYYKSSGDLRFAANTSGGSWSITTIDSKGDVGRYPSVALNPVTGRWGVAYEKTTTGDFRIAGQAKGGTWGIAVVDDTTQYAGGFISLAYDSAGKGAFSYYDAYNADLKYARYTGTKWTRSVVAAKNSQGLYTSLFFDPGNSGLPVIYYFNKTLNSVLAARSNGTGWSIETAATAGGRHIATALMSDGSETFSYLDDASGDVVVVTPS